MQTQNRNQSDFKPVRDYGAIGDCRSIALISKGGSVDWCCFPKFDAPSVFAAILDPQRGGHFSLGPINGRFESEQTYIENTNVLKEAFLTSTGEAEITDFMPCFLVEDEIQAFHEIHRIVECKKGEVSMCMEFSPRMNYAREFTSFEESRNGCIARLNRECLSLSSSHPVDVGDSGARSNMHLKAGEKALLVMRYYDDIVRDVSHYDSYGKLDRTIGFWKEWCSRITYTGEWRPAVIRSALLLRMLVYGPTGTIIAAPTTSLPEIEGGHKNWDYRFSWLRDSAMTVWAMYLVGHHSEKRRYMRWVRRRLRGQVRDLGRLKVLHGVEGDSTVREMTLDHLSGYRNSHPVRIGNAAYDQFQLDTYGSLVDAIHFTYDIKRDLTDDIWRIVQSMADFISENWSREDYSIWELRGKPLHYTYSKVMCWVAMDRAVRMAMRLGDNQRARKWKKHRDEIRREILEKCINKELNSFVQSEGSDRVDGSLLAIPLVGFISVKDPVMSNTISLVRERLEKDKMIFRFLDIPREADEGAFMMCSFWLVQCLALMGEIDKAVEYFEHLLSTTNHVGLMSEQVIPEKHEFVGNFPQGLSHISLIITADFLSKAINGKNPEEHLADSVPDDIRDE
ncbi:MAG TPA: glycoside hydrolase family 15 protein [Euryarchaeota archaeon]|nr:glycoside hydrolase family 15 protein [Euryarchaeota archaeon]